MATKKAAKKAAKKKPSSGSDPKSKRIVHNKMEKVMHEFKHGGLDRGRGGKVKNPKQAIAIGLSEARRSGADIPPNPNEKKKSANSKAVKKTPAKKSASNRKAAAKKKA